MSVSLPKTSFSSHHKSCFPKVHSSVVMWFMIFLQDELWLTQKLDMLLDDQLWSTAFHDERCIRYELVVREVRAGSGHFASTEMVRAEVPLLSRYSLPPSDNCMRYVYAGLFKLQGASFAMIPHFYLH